MEIEEVISFANEARNANGDVLILPSSEYLNRFLLLHQSQLEKENIKIGLCSSETYELISDKYAFGQLCEKARIKIPQEYSEVPDKFPFVVKPKKYAQDLTKVNEKPLLITNAEDLNQLAKIEDIENYYFQEFIEGRSIYLLYYIFKDGSYKVYSQENFIQQAEGASMILSKSGEFHKDKIAEKFANLFVESGFFGLVMVELKLNSSGFTMIEANPRLWGPSQLILDAQMDLFHCFAVENQLLAEKLPAEYLPETYYYWSGGIVSDQKNSKEITFHNFSEGEFIREFSKFACKDIYQKEDTINIYLNEIS
ncbi:ATP-grasp domain-containing protein [Algoriphagus pacificus]|uniref:ATP-grasp domain-containing protein n=1 Tax=Algoriphagus pacificus TaxID=2811234 RepID=A0ABS3CKF2_9BACT|nr:ATP-grasp domain-containing protein [Algoriphagus pacificus]MBN7817588.1 ATP-grasp domain-containing protein [Algoriphagus pacificus]